MKNTILIFIFSFVSAISHAQTVSRSNMDGMGGSNGNCPFTMANPHVGSYTTSNGGVITIGPQIGNEKGIGTGIRETTNDFGEVKIYPNPSSSEVIVFLTKFPVKARIELMDINGKTLLIINDIKSSNTINLTSHSAGIYFIRIFSEKNLLSSNYKIIKN